MKLVVLEGVPLNTGDLSWDALSALGELTVYDRTAPEQIVERAKDAQALFVNKSILTREILYALPNLKYIGLFSTGFNVVDLAAAKELGLVVTNIPAYSTYAVTQMVFALLLELTNQVSRHSEAVRSGAWSDSKDFCFWLTPLTELTGKTMGIIGMGQTGQQTARVALAMGMQVVAYSPRKKELDFSGVRWADRDTVLKEADVLCLHCPLNEETTGLINRETLALMKQGSYLINTSRGPVVNEEDLAQALNSGHLAGAGVDVLQKEPPKPDNPLFTAKNCVITPHIAWAAHETRARLYQVAVENFKAYLNGNPVNNVVK